MKRLIVIIGPNAVGKTTIIGFDLYSYSNDDPEKHEVRIEMGRKL